MGVFRLLDGNFSIKIDQSGKIFTFFFEVRISGVVTGPVMVLVPVRDEIEVPNWKTVLIVDSLHEREVVAGISVFKDWALSRIFVIEIEQFHGFLPILEFDRNVFLKIITEESK